MLLFVFLVATLNLGVGYALGNGLTLRDLTDELFAKLPSRSAKKSLDADIDDAPLSRPAPVVEPTAAKSDPQQVLASLASLRDGLKPSDGGSDSESEGEPVESSSDDALVEAAKTPADEADDIDSPPAEAPVPTANTASIDELFDRLEAMLAASAGDIVHHVGSIRVDPIDGQEADDALLTVVGNEIAGAAAELLTATQSFVAGTPSLVLLEGDSFDEARERLDGIRQRVEQACLSPEGSDVTATVTCAFADARSGDAREQVLEQLNLALDESVRYGTNRTYHHDGAFPTPIGDAEANAEETEEAVATAAG